jgi:hypothetical protein
LRSVIKTEDRRERKSYWKERCKMVLPFLVYFYSRDVHFLLDPGVGLYVFSASKPLSNQLP